MRRGIAASLAALLVGTTAVTAAIIGISAHQASASDHEIQVTASAAANPILAGELAQYDFRAFNPSTEPWYNLAFVIDLPLGVVPVAPAAILGVAPTVLTPAEEPTVPPGFARYIWNDVVDLPAGAGLSASLRVTVAQPVTQDDGTGQTDAVDVHPVGSSFSATVTAYASEDPRLLPAFPGSSATNPVASAAVTVLGETDAVEIAVEAIRVTVTEPSPESELLRGVHDHVTTYTIEIENTTEGSTNGIDIVTHLEPGLEFLGSGAVDNSAEGTEEYPGAGRLTGQSAPAQWAVPITVETITATAADAAQFGLVEGRVYTRVLWRADLAPGEVRQIQYLAGIPLFENAMPIGEAPSPESLGQTSWLDNNTGPSTRHGSAASAIDGRSQTTLFTATGAYQGVVRGDVGPGAEPADRTTSDAGTKTIDMMDVRILKSVANGTFTAGGIAEYTLQIDTSEYADASDLEVIDVLGDGLCAIVPTGTEQRTDPIPLPGLDGTVEMITVAATADWPQTECAPGAQGEAPAADELEWVAYDAVTGRFFAAFRVDALAASQSTTITYDAFMRQDYSQDGRGSTSATDDVRNRVLITASTVAPAGVADVAGSDVWQVADDSDVTLGSSPDAIGKQVLPRSVPFAAGGNPCAVAPSAYQSQLAGGFLQGDLVCYQLTVDFSSDADSRNPIVTDILPANVVVTDGVWLTLRDGISGDVMELPGDQWRVADGRVVVEPASYVAAGQRFVTASSQLIVHIQAEVTTFSVDPLELDKPENLMKFQQENVDGVIVFDRSQAEIEVQAGLQLLKGVASVDGATVSGLRGSDGAACDGSAADCDGILVREGDRVAYRVDVTGGPTSLTDPTPLGVEFDATDLTVWDRLPGDIQRLFGEASDPAALATALAPVIGDGGQLLLPGDAEYPSDAATQPGWLAGGPVLVVWQGLSVDLGDVLTLDYSIVMPQGLLIDTRHENTASIIEYTIVTNAGGAIDVRPSGSLSTLDGNAPGEGTRDVSDVFLPAGSLEKLLVATEIGTATDPQNLATSIVHGERATFEYTVTIPARTSVANGVLSDDQVLRITSRTGQATDTSVVSSAVTAPSVLPVGFAFEEATGTLTFPPLFTNDSDDDVEFTVSMVLRVTDRDSSTPTFTPNITNNATLVNTARFASDSWSSVDDASVRFREPNPSIQKVANPDSNVAIGSPVTYTVTVANPNRVALYDVEVVDAVPVGLIVDPASVTGGGVADAGAQAGAGGTITWQVAQIPTSAIRTYTATIDPATGGGQTYVNTVTATGYTLPASLRVDADSDRGDRVVTASETITAIRAELDKQVRIGEDTYSGSVSAPIGETVEYRVQTTLEANINYWRASLVDVLPAGVAFDPSSIEGPFIGGIDVSADWSFVQTGQRLTWTPNAADIVSAPAARTLEVRYEAQATDAVTADTLVNLAAFGWSFENDDDSPRTTVDDSATVQVVHPDVTIDKTVNGVASVTAEVDASLLYALTARNIGDSAAHDLVIVDDVPVGIIVDETSITPAPATISAGALAGAGGQIEWRLAGPLAVDGTVELGYSATFVAASSLSDSSMLENVVVVDEWQSFPEDGRTYGPSAPADADASPRFPDVAVAKSVGSTTVALAGEPFEWVLTARNDSDGVAQTVQLTDTLPVNWAYTATTSVLVGGAPVTAEPTVTGAGTASDPQVLTWTFGAAASDAALASGEQLVIRFTATPTELALTDAGVTLADGTPVPHHNRVTIDATDVRGEESNEDRDYAGPPDDAAAFLHSADVVVAKTAASTLTAGAGPGTGWTILVSNDGPDPAVGPITLTDVTAALPDGITVTSMSGTGWSCTVPVRAPDGVTTTDCSHPGVAGQLAAGASLPPLSVTVNVAADLDPALVPTGGFVNSATAESPTFDPQTPNNTDDDPLPIVFESDLVIVKTLATDAPTAGELISWTLQPRNDGPSISRADGDTPITIVDTLPAGVTNVSVAPNDDWLATTAGGFPASAGDEIVFRYVGTAMPLGATAPITLTGSILSGWPDGDAIVNQGTIFPGLTDDPDETNNTDDVSTTPGTSTALTVSKTRVVERDGTWVPAATADPEAPFVAGEQTAYRVVVTTVGPADARGVVVIDEAPAGFTYATHIDEQGSWSRTAVAAGDRFALGGDLVVGDAASFIVVFDTNPNIEGAVVNAVEASADNAPEPVRDEDGTGSNRVADLSLVKTHTGEAVAGETTSFTLTVTNEGPSDASLPITIDDLLPTGLSYVPGTALVAIAGGTATGLDPTVTDEAGRDRLVWQIGTEGASLPLGATVVVTFDTSIAAELPAQTLENVAVVSSPEDPNPTNNDGSSDFPIATLAEMTVSKAVSPGPWVAGTEVAYTITVTNAGPSVADARVVDRAPAGITITAISGDGWECAVVTATCERDAHPVSSTTIQVTATIDEAAAPESELINVAELTWTDSRGPHDDEDEVPVLVTALADVGVVKTAVDRATGEEITTAAAGSVVRYLIEITNYGPSLAAAPITVTDVLPEGLTYVGVTDPARWDCSTAGSEVTCVDASGLLAVGQTVQLELEAMIDAAAPTGSLTNTATGVSSTPEPDDAPQPNTDDSTIEVVQEASLRVAKSHDAGAVRIGERLTFTIDVSSDGPSDATEIVMTERIPAGLALVGFASEGDRWSFVSQEGSADTGTVLVLAFNGTLVSGASAPPVFVTVDVLPSALGSVVNIVEVTATQQPGDPAQPPSDEDEVIVPPLSTLIVEKTALVGPAGWMVGDEVQYKITVSNTGPTDTVNGVSVIDDMPAALLPVSASTTGGECAIDGQEVVCELGGGVHVGESRTVLVTAQLLAGAYPEVTNVVTIATDTQLTSQSIMQSSAVAHVAESPLPFTGLPDEIKWALLVAIAMALLGTVLVVVRRQLTGSLSR